MASRSGLIGFVVNEVNHGCHPTGCFRGVGGVVRVFLRLGALWCCICLLCFFPLGVVSTIVSVTHVGCHVTLNGMERMGVSSSSEFSLVRCAVVSPSIL